jgi:hypothetical protein
MPTGSNTLRWHLTGAVFAAGALGAVVFAVMLPVPAVVGALVVLVLAAVLLARLQRELAGTDLAPVGA